MDRKISRNEVLKRKKLTLGDNENTIALMNIAQENDSNLFGNVPKLVNKQPSIYHLKMF